MPLCEKKRRKRKGYEKKKEIDQLSFLGMLYNEAKSCRSQKKKKNKDK